MIKGCFPHLPYVHEAIAVFSQYYIYKAQCKSWQIKKIYISSKHSMNEWKRLGKLMSIWKRFLSLKYHDSTLSFNMRRRIYYHIRKFWDILFSESTSRMKKIYIAGISDTYYFNNSMTLAQTQNKTNEDKLLDKKSHLCIRSVSKLHRNMQ